MSSSVYGRKSVVRKRKIHVRRVAIVAAALLLFLTLLVRQTSSAFSEGGHRAVAERLNRAIVQHDMVMLRSLFAPSVSNDVAQDLRLGALADRLRALGEFRGLSVAHTAGAEPGTRFLASFTNGNLGESLTFADNRIVSFSVDSPE